MPTLLSFTAALLLAASSALAQLAIKAGKLHTMGPQGTITNGVVVITNGKIAAVGPATSTPIPDGYQQIEAPVATPGLIDAHCTIGLSGLYNTKHDSDQLERSAPIQPELRAIDAYNPAEPLIAFVRSFGVTTFHTGHAPGEAISGQTITVKATGKTVEEALLNPSLPATAIACTFGPSAEKPGDKSPGNRSKLIAMLREELIKAREYDAKRPPTINSTQSTPQSATSSEANPKAPDRNLRLEALASALNRQVPLLITAHRAQDISAALRLQSEFNFKLILDGAAESYLLTEDLKTSNTPVILHPSMIRAVGETENASFTTAAKLRAAGIPVALQGGYEAYVPKARIVLFEAALAAANGLTFDQALATITIDAAKILNLDSRIGSLEPNKDADLALYDGDPFEYTTHCTTVIINGTITSTTKR